MVSWCTYVLFQAPFRHFARGFLGCLLGCDLKAKLKEYENEESYNDLEAGEFNKAIGLGLNGISNPAEVTTSDEEMMDTNGNSVVIRL